MKSTKICDTQIMYYKLMEDGFDLYQVMLSKELIPDISNLSLSAMFDNQTSSQVVMINSIREQIYRIIESGEVNKIVSNASQLNKYKEERVVVDFVFDEIILKSWGGSRCFFSMHFGRMIMNPPIKGCW